MTKVEAESKRIDEMGEQVADVRNNLQTIRFQVDEIQEPQAGKEAPFEKGTGAGQKRLEVSDQ